MVSHAVSGLNRYAIRGVFTDATLGQAALAAGLCVVVMVVGEQVGRTYGIWDWGGAEQ